MPPSRMWRGWAGCESKVRPFFGTHVHPRSGDEVKGTGRGEQRLWLIR